ncbi:DNA alkylation repair protein [Kaistella sp. DKR-2]|uniref:DNA alkylation repair protein n=1 Tax=Kaistella soli TaxID=2849654 RepID=UPI001C267022|nr:DNA alkylation repair protein [Kaistella soli]MBU8883815.1 DNA alkylation repair protein [Kaistella soli]
MPTHSEEIKEALQLLSVPEKAEFFPRFFKAGKGGYAEGDKFIGVTVPDQRQVAKEFAGKISLEELRKLLSSKIHEHRHCALLMLVSKFEKSKSFSEKTEIVQFYLKNKKYINNWDLVDNSCYKILGRFCFENKDGSILRDLSDEDNLWSKRMAVVGTMYYVKRGEFGLMKEFALKNLHYPHDLMHKANGWLLREMGQKNESELLAFLNLHYRKMPRTSLRYAIEKLDEDVRQDYLKGRI